MTSRATSQQRPREARAETAAATRPPKLTLSHRVSNSGELSDHQPQQVSRVHLKASPPRFAAVGSKRKSRSPGGVATATAVAFVSSPSPPRATQQQWQQRRARSTSPHLSSPESLSQDDDEMADTPEQSVRDLFRATTSSTTNDRVDQPPPQLAPIAENNGSDSDHTLDTSATSTSQLTSLTTDAVPPCLHACVLCEAKRASDRDLISETQDGLRAQMAVCRQQKADHEQLRTRVDRQTEELRSQAVQMSRQLRDLDTAQQTITDLQTQCEDVAQESRSSAQRAASDAEASVQRVNVEKKKLLSKFNLTLERLNGKLAQIDREKQQASERDTKERSALAAAHSQQLSVSQAIADLTAQQLTEEKSQCARLKSSIEQLKFDHRAATADLESRLQKSTTQVKVHLETIRQLEVTADSAAEKSRLEAESWQREKETLTNKLSQLDARCHELTQVASETPSSLVPITRGHTIAPQRTFQLQSALSMPRSTVTPHALVGVIVPSRTNYLAAAPPQPQPPPISKSAAPPRTLPTRAASMPVAASLTSKPPQPSQADGLCPSCKKSPADVLTKPCSCAFCFTCAQGLLNRACSRCNKIVHTFANNTSTTKTRHQQQKQKNLQNK